MGDDVLEDVRVKSVPPHVSDVIASADSGTYETIRALALHSHGVGAVALTSCVALRRLFLMLVDVFWRNDMDSYAANRHNEDRSQYVVDAIADAQTGAATPTFFCACYDGHGGEEAVDYVQKNLYNNIHRHLMAGDETISHSIISVRVL